MAIFKSTKSIKTRTLGDSGWRNRLLDDFAIITSVKQRDGAI